MANASLGAKPQASRRSPRSREMIGLREFSARSIVAYVFLAVVTLYFLTPLYWLAISATKDNTDLFSSFGLWFAHFNLFQNLADTFTFQDGIYLRWIPPSMRSSAGCSPPSSRSWRATRWRSTASRDAG